MRNFMLVVALALAACGHDSIGPDVGGSCTSNADCTQRCLFSPQDPQNWPGGFCTVACTVDADCPHGAACTKEGGGVCLQRCATNADCAGLGNGWRRRGRQGFDQIDRLVCTGD